MKHTQDKINSLNEKILDAVAKDDMDLAREGNNSKQYILNILNRRQDAAYNHKYGPDALIKFTSDELYIAAKNAGDEATIEKMQSRTLTKQEYLDLSMQYSVNDQFFLQEKIDAEIARSQAYQKALGEIFPENERMFAVLEDKLLNNPAAFGYIIDRNGSVMRRFHEIDLAIKDIDFSSLPDDLIEKFKAKDLIHTLDGTPAGEREIVCITQKAINTMSPELKELLDKEYNSGNVANETGNNKLREYLAELVGISYDPTLFYENSDVYRLEMYARAALGWNWENISLGKDYTSSIIGDTYLQNNGKSMKELQVIYFDDERQSRNRRGYGVNSASLAVVAFPLLKSSF